MHVHQTVNLFQFDFYWKMVVKGHIYIINYLMARLKLNPVRKEQLTLNTFVNKNVRKKECEMIEVRLQGRQGSTVTIGVLSFPTTCAPLPSPVEVDQYLHLQGLELADQSLDLNDNSESIDALIGSDFYWDVVTGDHVALSTCCDGNWPRQ